MFQAVMHSFERTLKRRPHPESPSSPGEARCRVRHIADLRVTCQPAGSAEDQDLRATVHDLSAVGLSLVLARKFKPGTLLGVELPGAAVLARVVRTAARADGDWLVGCVFADELSEEELQAFGAERLRAAPSDPRAWVRFPCTATALCRPARAETSGPWPARVVDLSPRGVGVLADRPAEVGAILKMTFQGGEGQPLPVMLACVVHATAQEEGRWALGCMFIRELEAHEFPALGRGNKRSGRRRQVPMPVVAAGETGGDSPPLTKVPSAPARSPL